MRTTHLTLAAMLLLTAAPTATYADALTERVKAWDEGPNDGKFLKFRNELKSIIARKDAAALFTHLASDIKIDFGGFGGGPEFHKMWKPFDPNSPLWPALSLVVEQGGNFDAPVRFSAPYAYSAFPSDLDGMDKVVVTTEGALMRAKPEAGSATVRPLDHDILTVVGDAAKPQHEAGDNDWVEVKDAKGITGFILARDVRSPLDYRAYFEVRKGKWEIAMFLAGD